MEHNKTTKTIGNQKTGGKVVRGDHRRTRASSNPVYRWVPIYKKIILNHRIESSGRGFFYIPSSKVIPFWDASAMFAKEYTWIPSRAYGKTSQFQNRMGGELEFTALKAESE